MSNDPDNRQERFLAFHEANFAPVLGYALRRCATREDAGDVTADAFLVAWRAFDRVPAGIEGRLWLFGVARRCLQNHQRTTRRRDRLSARLIDELAGQFPAAGVEAPNDPGLAVRRALLTLAEPDRELLTLIAWEELTPAQAAGVLGISAGTARVRLHRAKDRFRRRLVELAPSSGAGAVPVRRELTPLRPVQKES